MVKFDISDAVARDICTREIPDAPFCNITDAGTYCFSVEETRELQDDAEYYGGPSGPGQSIDFGTRMAYLALGRKLAKVLPPKAA